MADFFTYNNRNGSERHTLDFFLKEVEEHAPRDPNLTPKDVVDVRNVIRWMRTKLDLKPSEMRAGEPKCE